MEKKHGNASETELRNVRFRNGRFQLEVKMFDELRGIVERDYDVFSGKALEGYFRRKFLWRVVDAGHVGFKDHAADQATTCGASRATCCACSA